MTLSIITLIISIIIFLGVIIGLIVYTWYKLRKDLILFKKIAPVSSVTPTDGTNGTDGVSAYQQYLIDNGLTPLTFTESQFEALFTGSDGIDGANAPAALDGSDADTGSTGVHGEMGVIGINGDKGIPGMKGLHGETFFNFYYNIGIFPVIPPGITNYCKIENFSNDLYYYENSIDIFSAFILYGSGISTDYYTQYISFILYNPDNTIKGITGPLTMRYKSDISSIDLQVTSSLQFRYIVSQEKYLTSSSFSRNIIETTYDNDEIIYVKSVETDPFIAKLYDLISLNPNLQYDVNKLEKIFISKKQTYTTLIDLMPVVF